MRRFERMRRRDWRDPFSWFNWYHENRGSEPFFTYNGNNDPRSFGGTFARADASTCATYLDGAGIVKTMAANIPRYQHYDPSNLSLGPLLLLEGAGTNLVVQSDALATTWTASGTPNAANAVGTYAGRPFSRIAYSANWATDYVSQTVAFTGNAVKAFALLAKQDAAATGTFEFFAVDTTAVANRVQGTLTVAAGGAISCAMTVGTLLRTEALADGVYRFWISSTSVTAANTNVVRLGSGVGTVTTILLSGIQAQNATFPSSLIPTTTAAVTRAADALSFPFLPVPMAMTLYADYVDVGNALQSINTATTVAFQLSDAPGTNPYFGASFPNGKARINHNNGSALVTSTQTATAPAMGSRVELRNVLQSDGSVISGQSLASAAETVIAASAANTLAAAWSATTIWATANSGAGANNFPFIALRSLKIAAGVQTLSKMRSL